MTRDENDRLSDSVAQRVLTRAAELDSAQRLGVSIPDLKAAALEAGIAASALDQALNELTNPNLPVAESSAPLAILPRRRRGLITILAIALLAMFLGFAVVRSVPPRKEPAPWPTSPTR